MFVLSSNTVHVCLSSGYNNKIARTGQLKKIEIYFLLVLETGCSRSRCQHGRFLVRALPLGWPTATFSVCLPCGGDGVRGSEGKGAGVSPERAAIPS